MRKIYKKIKDFPHKKLLLLSYFNKIECTSLHLLWTGYLAFYLSCLNLLLLKRRTIFCQNSNECEIDYG